VSNQPNRSYTLAEWCELRRISLPMFYKLDNAGRAPRTHYAGKKRLVGPEADVQWLREREAESASTTAEATAA
jgi:hypothetical protein